MILKAIERAEIYLKFYLKASTIYNIHPPYLYEFIQFVFDKKRIYYDFNMIHQLIQLHKVNHTQIPEDSFSISKNQNGLSISQFFIRAGHHQLEYETLYRIALFLKSSKILELGSCLGISAASLALAQKNAIVQTIEGNRFLADICNSLFSKLNLKNCHCIHHEFNSFLPLLETVNYDLLFLDGDHQYEATIRYVEKFLASSTDHAVIILDDIHWSKEMYLAWKKVIQLPGVQCSLETYRWGLLFKNSALSEGNFVYIDYYFKPWNIGLFNKSYSS